jgi:NAD-dependent SIR2 family protein deacetylase
MLQENPLGEFIERYPRLFVLTGAGCSTDSGIPDYRDENGGWKRTQPVMFQAFIGDLHTQRRYWARSLVGWRRFGHARPNDAHRALARLERQGRAEVLVTQNVDGLHQAAGSTAVAWARLDARDAPDGDADLEGLDFSGFAVPACEECGGLLKPDVVFFGESVPQERVAAALAAVQRADAMLVIGSSLMVYSGYRFVQAAANAGKPIAALNLGRTRADALLSLKVNQPCGAALAFLLD